MAVSLEVRRKVLAAAERGESPASVAKRFEIGERSVYRLKSQVREGQPLEPDKTGPKELIKLTPDDMQLLRQSVDDRPGGDSKGNAPAANREGGAVYGVPGVASAGAVAKKSP